MHTVLAKRPFPFSESQPKSDYKKRKVGAPIDEPFLSVPINSLSQVERVKVKVEELKTLNLSSQEKEEQLCRLLSELSTAEELCILIRFCGECLSEFDLSKFMRTEKRWFISDQLFNSMMEKFSHFNLFDLNGCISLCDPINTMLKFSDCVETIRLKDCCKIEYLQHLSSFTKLRELNLAGCGQLTNENLDNILKKCTKLSILNLDYCHLITDAGMLRVSSCLCLETLSLWRCTLVTDETVKALENCKSLKILDLWGCSNFSEEALLSLVTSLPDLTFLGLKDIPCATPALINRLKTLNPNLAIDSFLNASFG